MRLKNWYTREIIEICLLFRKLEIYNSYFGSATAIT